MGTKPTSGVAHMPEGGKSRFEKPRMDLETLDFSTVAPAQPGAKHCASPSDADLGEPIPINKVAAMIGCSVWTVRQRLLQSGLPHFRIGHTGKLLFYRNQVIRWILAKQLQKGGEVY